MRDGVLRRLELRLFFHRERREARGERAAVEQFDEREFQLRTCAGDERETRTCYICSRSWKTYIERKDTFDKLHGDQNVITDLMWEHKQKVYFPDEWTYSYKWPERGKPKKYEKYSY